MCPGLAERLTAEEESEGLPHERLSPRQFQVLIGIAEGKTLAEIADELGLIEATIRYHRLKVTEKLGIRNDVGLAYYALRYRLVHRTDLL